jgi:hypothetical protein
VRMTAALIAMTGGVIGTIGVTNGKCTGTVTAGFTNLGPGPGPVTWSSNQVQWLTIEVDSRERKGGAHRAPPFLSITFYL